MSKLLHELFEEKTNFYPNNIALKLGEETLTYKELNEKSTILSFHLRSAFVKQGDVVKICLDRSFEMFIGILAILKSGAAYMPIDPEISSERLQFLCEDNKHPLFISKNATSEKHKDVLSSFLVLNLDSDWAEGLGEVNKKDRLQIDEDTSAVVLYTSGSTGVPKGVLLSHKALTNHIKWNLDNYNLLSDNVVLQHASYTFDFSLLEIFIALGSGSTLVLTRPKFHYESFYLIDLIQKEKVSVLCSVPSLLKSYVKFEEFSNCTSLEIVFLGGEALSTSLVKDFFDKSKARLINTYGPTECSIAVLHWECQRKQSIKSIPIGNPIADMEIHLLGKDMAYVNDGEIGEIYISGPGVAKEYYNRPELTSSHFLLGYTEERVYKTGDLGSRSKEGSYQFHGRVDHQIKVRGHRIELKEIEYHLLNFDFIENCVVTGFKNDGEETKIIAYYISSQSFSIDELRLSLLTKLPEYMVPNLFVALKSFPLSSNGKINRKNLPIPDKSRLNSGISYVAPYTEIQKKIVKIWEEVLEVRPVGIHDAYYYLGGDSLRNVMIFNLIERELQWKYDISNFLEADTVEKQAALISSTRIEKQTSEVVCLKSDGNETPILIVQLVQGEGFVFSKNLSNNIHDDHPIYSTVSFGLEKEKIPATIEESAAIYSAALEKKCPSEKYILIGYSMSGLVAAEIASILEAKGKEIEFLFMLDTYHPDSIINIYNKKYAENRVVFYLRKYLRADIEEKKRISSFLSKQLKQKIKNLKKKEVMKNLMLRPLVFVKIIDRSKRIASDTRKINIPLAMKYSPKKIQSNIVLVVGLGEQDCVGYRDNSQVVDLNISNLKKDISSEVFCYKIPVNHNTILEKENLKLVANLFSDYLSKANF